MPKVSNPAKQTVKSVLHQVILENGPGEGLTNDEVYSEACRRSELVREYFDAEVERHRTQVVRRLVDSIKVDTNGASGVSTIARYSKWRQTEDGKEEQLWLNLDIHDMDRGQHVLSLKEKDLNIRKCIGSRDKFTAYVNENVLTGQKPLPMFRLSNGSAG